MQLHSLDILMNPSIQLNNGVKKIINDGLISQDCSEEWEMNGLFEPLIDGDVC